MHDSLDLDRYPQDRPGSAEWQALVNRCRDDLTRTGMFNLEGLMRAETAASETAALLPRFASDAFLHERMHNIYFKPVADLPPDHPALRRFHTSNRTLCADQLGGSALMRLYDWPEFARFLAATMDKPVLYPMDDPLARVNVMSYQQGQALNWHFDRSEFTTTLLLQAPEAGGGFEYRTDLRSDADPNYDGVARLLAGGDPEARTITLSPGTLNVFKGKNTAHRVTPVEGARARVIAVFSYFEQPGVTFTEAERTGFYGRAG
ncbi:2OG-Fe(II) oxygenase [Ruegeria sp. WL0004]|uniref:2OG-Fe(II) oxygenase n=1 Tax=Ruegeria marisflavi TaxID=2984152 RepID=A0ABT2WVS8_9RHOB|nr:2OG-Fe(II) oxygenase [Ruegeria sp. WL0004]MCU9840000.1 2OG-Fe(II) oxygenase [Ruegeria sp. WL0004]